MVEAAFDAAVIGGGPAGCSAAITLAAAGARVALLEARRYPHDKLCGEFLSPECAGLLEALGVGPALRALNPVAITSALFTAPSGAAWLAPLPGPAWGLTRRTLDAALAEHAQAVGVRVLAGHTVLNVRGGLAEGFALDVRETGGPTHTVRARAVIGAHGKRAALDRALNRRFLRRPQPFVALKAHFYGPPVPGRVELHGFPGGYCGFSEIEPGAGAPPRHALVPANVCLLAQEAAWWRAGAPGPERLPAFVRWMQSQNPRLGAWLAQAQPAGPRWLTIAQVPFSDKRPVVAGVLMAGDSAGLIAPLAGDGIAMALRGGQLAAEHAAAFLGGALDPDSLPRAYAAAWRAEFGGRLRLARWLQGLMLRPSVLALGLGVLAGVPALGRFLVAHTRGPAVPLPMPSTAPGQPSAVHRP